MENLSVFIPTRNRPLQLDSCLKTIIKTVDSLKTHFYILERNSEKFVDNFNLCIHENVYNYGIETTIIKENNFRSNLIDILSKVDTKYILCMTDDTVFCRYNVNFDNIFEYLDNNENVLTYSLRIGENCKIQDPLTNSKSLSFHDNWCSYEFLNYEQFYEFDCSEKPLDSNLFYQISMDGHIYRTKDLLRMCQETPFINLREWESNLIQNSRRDDWMFRNKPNMACGITSSVVNLIFNQQLPPYSNNVSKFQYSAEELNNYFSQGRRINIRKTIGEYPEGSHIFRQIVLD